MKKLICLLISIVISAQMLAVPAFAEANADGEYWKTMVSFGVVTPDKDKNSTFTIAEMSQMVYSLLNPNSAIALEGTRQIYTDVDRWHWAAGYIEWLYDNKVYTGNGEGIYEPERNATLSDVCTLMLNLLGYQKVIEYTNEEADVIKKAMEINLLSSRVNKTEHELTYDEFASICFELLTTDVIESTFSQDAGFKNGGEFIEEVLEISYAKGIMTGANGYSLTFENCAENYVIVDGNKFFAGDADFSEYIGYSVKYYYNDDDALIAAVPLKNKELVIASEDILGYANNRYSYKAGSKRKTAKTDSVMLLYNGKPTTNRSAFIPAYGQVRLIDNDGDGSYECAIVENAYNIVLEKVANGVIYGKNADSITKKKYVIDTADFDLCKVIGLGDNSLDALKPNTAISVVISEDGKYAKLYITDEKVSGMLTGYDLTEAISVDDKEYKPANVVFNPNSITTLGNDVTLLLDVYGNVFAILGNHENKYVIGYLMSAKVTDDDELLLQILTSDSLIKKIKGSEKLNIDGVRAESATDAKSKLTEGELIKYMVSGEEVKYIDTAVKRAGTEKITSASDKDSFRMVADGNMLYKSGPQIFKKYGTMNLYSEFAVTDDTIVFFVPSENEYTSNNDYYVATRTSIESDLVADVTAYVTGAFVLTADAIVITYNTRVALSTGVTVIDSITVGLNEDDEVISVVKGMSGGKEIEIKVADASLLSGLDKGSVIRYRANKNGLVKAIDNIYSSDGSGLLNKNAKHTYTAGTSGVNANRRMVLGRITTKNGSFALFEFKDNVSDMEIFSLKNCNFYIYSEEEGLKLGNIDDIYDYEHYGEKCDEVIVCMAAVTTSDVIIIRK